MKTTVAPHQYGNMIFCAQAQTKQTKRRIRVKVQLPKVQRLKTKGVKAQSLTESNMKLFICVDMQTIDFQLGCVIFCFYICLPLNRNHFALCHLLFAN